MKMNYPAHLSSPDERRRAASRRMLYMVAMGLMVLSAVIGSSVIVLTRLTGKVSAATATGSYTWSRANIGGGGYNTGLIADPTQPGVIYARGDVEGCFRWDPTNQVWSQMMDSIYDNSATDLPTTFTGCLGLAVDPNPPAGQHVLYGAFGSNINYDWGVGADQGIYKSTDGGNTWTQVFSILVDGNGGARTLGESLQVDPSNSNVVYWGSDNFKLKKESPQVAHGGLFRSVQAGASGSWQQVSSVPIGTTTNAWDIDAGVRTVLLDPRQGTVSGSAIGVSGQVTKVIYLFDHSKTTADQGMYWSTDGGATFSKMTQTGAPTSLNRMDLGPGNSVYASTDSGIYVFDGSGTWSVLNGTSGTGFNAMASDPANRKQLIAMEEGNNWPVWVTHDTTTATVSWTSTQYAYQAKSDNWNTWLAAPSSLLFDTSSSSSGSTPRVFEADAYGVRVTQDIYATPANVVWTSVVKGLETTVVRQMSSPEAPATTVLHVGTADVWGFRITDLSKWAAQSPPSSQINGSRDTAGIAVGTPNWNHQSTWNSAPTDVVLGTTANVFTSTNDGATWTSANLPSPLPSGVGADEMAISAGNRDNVVYLPPGLTHFYYTNNAFSGGTSITWTASADLPDTIGAGDLYSSQRKLTADQGIPGKFYYSLITGTSGNTHIEVFVSTDGGKTWAIPSGNQSTVLPGIPDGNNTTFLTAPPDSSNEVWLGGLDGLYRSTDGGANFTKMAAVNSARAYTFGVAAPGQTNATVFVAGTVTIGGQQINGIFRSDDSAQTFVQINDAAHHYSDIRLMEGDKQVFGRVFISNASGVIVGTLNASTVTPTPSPTPSPTPTGGSLPSPWLSQDVGSVAATGSATYSSSTFTVAGSGSDIWNNSDGFRYAYQPLSGDGSIVAHVASQSNTNAWAKAGVMIRETLDASSTHALMALTPGNGAAFQRRTSTNGASTNTSGSSVSAPYWVKLTRQGSTFTGYVSSDGSAWTQVGSDTVSMASSVYIGLAVSSHSDGTLSTATFDNVTVSTAGSALSRSGWTASASNSGSGKPASNALDGDLTTRWGSGVAQSNGLYFQVDMGATKSFSKITIDNTNSPYDYPRGYAVYVSSDGSTWGSAIATGSGSGNVTTITFSTQSARYIKVTETGSDPVYWWSIDEFNVYS